MTTNFRTSGNSDTELDFTEHWSFFNVQQEILRGIQLRQEKPVVNETEYDLMDVDFSIPSCSKRKVKKEYQNSPTSKTITHRRNQKVTKKKRLKKLSKHKSKDQHCPLRIVELAEPLKIQCLNTWKNNCRVLPDYMVDRLRRHVEDKNPVVQISDAVHYFRKKKSSSKKCAIKRPIAKHPRERDIRDILLLCAIFGYKIKQKLLTPANIMLNPELAKINHIVSDEINSIVRNKKGKNIYKNDKVLVEMSKKVTIWIASVLEESSYKLLLEQLDELEEKEGPVLDFIDELLDNIPIPSESSISSEFTEDNNIRSTTSSKDNIVVTDSIEDNISRDVIDLEKHDYTAPANIDQLLTKNVEENISGHDIYDDDEQNDTKTHFRSLLEDRINYVVDSASNVELEGSNNIEPVGSNVQLSSSGNNVYIDIPLNLANNINNLAHGTDEKYISKNDTFISLDDLANKSKSNLASSDSKAELLSSPGNDINEVSSDLESNKNILINDKEYIDNDDTKISMDNLEAENAAYITVLLSSKTDLTSKTENVLNELPLTMENNINNVLPVMAKEYISLDDNFISLEDTSDIDRPKDTSEDIEQPIILADGVDEQQNNPTLESDTVVEAEEDTKKVKFSDIFMDNIGNNTGINKLHLETHDFKPVVWKSSKDYITSHFNVAPPNPYLLSDMDELWPEYKLPPLLKATESVSKSVTSLGRILESDEGSLISSFDKSSVENVQKSLNKGPDFAKIKSTDKGDNIPMLNKIDSTVLEDLLNEVITKEWQRESKSTSDKIDITNILEPKILQTTREKITQDCGDVKSIKRDVATQSDVLHTNTSLTNIVLSDTVNMNNASIMKTDKNVQTSAVIIFSRDDEVGLKQYDVKKWCIGLLNVTANLEMWADWIQNVCVNASRLKHKENASKTCQFTTKHINKWIDLKQSINIDAQSWMELKRHLRRGLKKYKTTCRNQNASIQDDKKRCKCNKHFKYWL